MRGGRNYMVYSTRSRRHHSSLEFPLRDYGWHWISSLVYQQPVVLKPAADSRPSRPNFVDVLFRSQRPQGSREISDRFWTVIGDVIIHHPRSALYQLPARRKWAFASPSLPAKLLPDKSG
jgi:hypothetical protein